MGVRIKCHFNISFHEVCRKDLVTNSQEDKLIYFYYIFHLTEFSLYSFITVTFVIETMASANAIVTWRHIQHRKRVSVSRFILYFANDNRAFQHLKKME